MKRSTPPRPRWRVGTKIKLNVYDGNRPVCQCHTQGDAARIVLAMNRYLQWLESITK
jgi:hypothetical protein